MGVNKTLKFSLSWKLQNNLALVPHSVVNGIQVWWQYIFLWPPQKSVILNHDSGQLAEVINEFC